MTAGKDRQKLHQLIHHEWKQYPIAVLIQGAISQQQVKGWGNSPGDFTLNNDLRQYSYLRLRRADSLLAYRRPYRLHGASSPTS